MVKLFFTLLLLATSMFTQAQNAGINAWIASESLKASLNTDIAFEFFSETETPALITFLNPAGNHLKAKTAHEAMLPFLVSAPSVSTNAATSITAFTATLNGSANPNGEATTGWFRYATVNPGTGNNSSGTRIPASGGTVLGSGTLSVSFSEGITGLAANTTYYYWAIADNPSGMQFGNILTFTTSAPPPPPTVITNAATSVTAFTATLNGSANPNGSAATGWFRYATVSPGTGNNSAGTRIPASGGTALGSGTSPVSFSEAITGLSPNTTYFYWAIADNPSGMQFGNVLTFTTSAPPPAPTVSTNAATSVTSLTATLNGSANPNGSATTGWYRYSIVSPGSPNDSYGTRVPATGGTSLGSGSSAVNFSEAITGLAPATTYYYSAIAQNVSGTAFGTLHTFTTPALPPSNVGIGTNTPQSKLHIIGGSALSLTNNSGFLTLGSVDGGNLVLDSNTIQVRNNGATGDMVLQKLGGQIMIGSGTPNRKLSVNGGASKTDGGSWDVFSDMRLKQNIQPYTDGLSSLLKIKPVWFQYIPASGFDSETRYVGVLAQQLQQVSPYMVSESATNKAPDGSNYLSVNNSAMTYMLINAVKEQQEMIEQLKKEIEKLKSPGGVSSEKTK